MRHLFLGFLHEREPKTFTRKRALGDNADLSITDDVVFFQHVQVPVCNSEIRSKFPRRVKHFFCCYSTFRMGT